jgi:hypothetical protein
MREGVFSDPYKVSAEQDAQFVALHDAIFRSGYLGDHWLPVTSELKKTEPDIRRAHMFVATEGYKMFMEVHTPTNTQLRSILRLAEGDRKYMNQWRSIDRREAAVPYLIDKVLFDQFLRIGTLMLK